MTSYDASKARIDRLLDRLGELVEQAPERELAPALGDVHGPIGRPADSPPLAWPEGLPWPLTARQALDAVQTSRTLLADEMTAEIGAAVAVLVDLEAQATVLADAELVAAWRLPFVSVLVEGEEAWYGDSYSARIALWRLLVSWVQELEPADVGRWPDPQLSHSDVAQWAREALNRLYPAKPAVYQSGLGLDPQAFAAEFPGKLAAGDALVAEVESWGEIRHTLLLPSQDGLRVELHRSGLAAVCLAVRRLPRNLAAAAWEAVQQWASDAPGDLHNKAARQAIEKEKKPASAVATLARELHKRTPELVLAIAKPTGLAVDEVPEREGMLALDADLADWVEHVANSENSDKARENARKRLNQYKAQELTARQLFARWLDGGALTAAAVILLRKLTDGGLRVLGVQYGGDHYTTAPRLLAPMTWALGGAGTAAPTIDGDAYAAAPAVARYLPRVATLRDLSKRPKAQRALPVEVDAPAEVQVLADAQFVVSPFTAKVALAMLTLAPADGELMRGTLGELCRLVMPVGRVQGRDYERLATGLQALRSLALVLADDTSVTLFNDIRGPADPRTAKPDQPVEWSLSRIATAATSKGGDWPGRFLFNFSGAMRLSAKTEAQHLRAYLVCAALWNGARPEGEFDPHRVPAGELDSWADRFNLLSPTALESTSAASRVKLSENRKATRETLEQLATQHNLIKLEKVGRDSWRPLPPEPLLEAYRIHRKRGGRLL